MIKVSGNIYVICPKLKGQPCKIGRTQQEPIERLKGMQTDNYEELELVISFFYEDASNLELRILEHFKLHRIRGEWFDLDAATLVEELVKFIFKKRKRITSNKLEETQYSCTRTENEARDI